MRQSKLEEFLQGSPSLLSNIVDFLAKLLHQLANQSLIEIGLVSAKLNLDFVVITGGDDVNILLKRSHGSLSHPRTNVTSPINGIIVHGNVEGLQDFLSEFSVYVFEANCLHDQKE